MSITHFQSLRRIRDTPPPSSHHYTRSTCGKKLLLDRFLVRRGYTISVVFCFEIRHSVVVSYVCLSSPPPFPSCDGKKKCLFLKVLPLPFSVCPSQLLLKNSLRTIPLLLIVPKGSFPCHEWICPRFFPSLPPLLSVQSRRICEGRRRFYQTNYFPTRPDGFAPSKSQNFAP